MDWSLRGCVLHYFSIGDNCCEGGRHSRKNKEGKVTNHVSQYILTIGLFSFVIETKLIVFLWSRYAEGKASSDSFNVYVSSTYAACSCKTVNTDYGHPMKLSKNKTSSNKASSNKASSNKASSNKTSSNKTSSSLLASTRSNPGFLPVWFFFH